MVVVGEGDGQTGPGGKPSNGTFKGPGLSRCITSGFEDPTISKPDLHKSGPAGGEKELPYDHEHEWDTSGREKRFTDSLSLLLFLHSYTTVFSAFSAGQAALLIKPHRLGKALGQGNSGHRACSPLMRRRWEERASPCLAMPSHLVRTSVVAIEQSLTRASSTGATTVHKSHDLGSQVPNPTGTKTSRANPSLAHLFSTGQAILAIVTCSSTRSRLPLFARLAWMGLYHTAHIRYCNPICGNSPFHPAPLIRKIPVGEWDRLNQLGGSIDLPLVTQSLNLHRDIHCLQVRSTSKLDSSSKRASFGLSRYIPPLANVVKPVGTLIHPRSATWDRSDAEALYLVSIDPSP